MSNLPPGVSPSDIDQAYGGRTDDHEHQYVPLDDNRFILEDCAAIFQYRCEWAPVLDSAHSERHDETFYETGEPCNEARSIGLEVTDVDVDGDDRAESDEQVLEIIERAWYEDPDEVTVVECAPPRPGHLSGRLVVSYQDITAIYGEKQ